MSDLRDQLLDVLYLSGYSDERAAEALETYALERRAETDHWLCRIALALGLDLGTHPSSVLLAAERAVKDVPELEPGRWWRVVQTSDGHLWCETSDEREARASMVGYPDGYFELRRLYEGHTSVWRKVQSPTEEPHVD